MKRHVVIMAGGVGSRLYPLSTPEHPKQFIDLLGAGRTMIQLTYERFLAVNPDAEFWVVTSKDYVHFVREQLPMIPESHILAEPAARNTAPCIAYACWKIMSECSDANIVVTPADAYVPDHEAFAQTINKALAFTESNDAIVCVGIDPTAPCTQYGYIQAPSSENVEKVVSFKEKPDLATAQKYLASGGYFWNAGIFVWNIHTIENALRTHAPQICEVMDRMAAGFWTDNETHTTEALFPTCDKISIDYAVMEKSDCVFMVAGRWEWSDLGSFEAIEKITGKKVQ